MINFYENLLRYLLFNSSSILLVLFLLACFNTILSKIIVGFFELKTKSIIEFISFVKSKEALITGDSKDSSSKVFNLHKKLNYNPLYQLVELVPFLVQVPFLLSVYYAILNFQDLNNFSILYIESLLEQDKLLYGINLLPIMMFLVNLVQLRIDNKNFSLKNLIFPIFFLIILYTAPSSLLIYWIISLILNTSIKNFDIYKKVNSFPKLIITPTFLFFYLLKFDSLNNLLNVLIFLFTSLILEILLIRYIKKYLILLYPFLFIFLFNNYIRDILIYIQDYFGSSFYIGFLPRTIIILLIVSIWLFNRKKSVFFFYLMFVLIIFSSPKSNINIYEEQKLDYELSDTKKNKETLLLIILDEYSSYKEIQPLTQKNLNIYNEIFKDRGWLVKDEFYSYELATENSIFSLFNYNLSYDKEFNKSKFSDLYNGTISQKGFQESKLNLDLIRGSYKVKNYGIFNLSNQINDDFIPLNLYLTKGFYSTIHKLNNNLAFVDNNDFFGDILRGSLLDYFEEKNFIQDYNQKIFNFLNPDELKNYDFSYIHIRMPHPPLYFINEFEKIETNLDNYIKFWEFTNVKFLDQIKNFEKKDFKIIVTGDHGIHTNNYPNDSKDILNKIDGHNTFAVFYGFEQENLVDINSVQDLGKLIFKTISNSNN